jgi:putative SOS response-associated peptidase YedK
VAPTQDVRVIVNKEAAQVYKTMWWGLIPFWVKDETIGDSLINVRIKSIATKPGLRAHGKNTAA